MKTKILLLFTLLFLFFSVSAYADYEIRNGERVWVGKMIIDPTITGGTITGSTITNSPISGNSGSFTGLSSTGTFDADRYFEIWIPANQMTPNATSGATAGTTETTTNKKNYDYYAFDKTTDEFVEFSVVMRPGWDRSTVKAKFYWIPGTGASNAETVKWGIGGIAIADDAVIDVALGTPVEVADTVTAGTTGDLLISGATAVITVGGSPALGNLVHFKAHRDPDTDDMAGDALLIGVTIQGKLTNAVAAW